MKRLLFYFLLLITCKGIAQDTLHQQLVQDFFKAVNQNKRTTFYSICYQYNSNIEFYKEAYRYFYYRTQYRVFYDIDEISEIELVGEFENDSIKVQYGKYNVPQKVDIGENERYKAHQDLNECYNNKDLNTRLDPLNIIRKTTFFSTAYEQGFIEGIGQQYFLFFTTKATGKMQLIPFDLSHSWALSQVLEFDFILEAFRLTQKDCDATKVNLNKLGADVFAAIQSNNWYPVYCEYGITAEVLDSTENYDFPKMSDFQTQQNDFLHELHSRQDIVRINVDRLHREMQDQSPQLFMVHTLEQEDQGKFYCNVILELKIENEFDYVLVLCEKKWNGWRINNGPLRSFSSATVLDYIKNLNRE